MHDPAAWHHAALLRRLICEERKLSERASQIGRAHTRDRKTIIAVHWRKVGRHSNYRHLNPVLRENLPEWLSLPERRHLSGGDRKVVRADRDGPRAFRRLRHGRVRSKRLRIAVHEIENSVAAWIHPGYERGPRHGTLRGHGGFQALELTLFPKLVQIRQCIPVMLHEVRIHAVDTQHDHALA